MLSNIFKDKMQNMKSGAKRKEAPEENIKKEKRRKKANKDI